MRMISKGGDRHFSPSSYALAREVRNENWLYRHKCPRYCEHSYQGPFII